MTEHSRFVLVPGSLFRTPERQFVIVLESDNEEVFDFEHLTIKRCQELFADNKRFYVKSRITMEEMVTIIPIKEVR
jgi:hypothetical protein